MDAAIRLFDGREQFTPSKQHPKYDPFPQPAHKQIADLVKHSMQMQNWQVHADFCGGIKGFDATRA